MIHDEIKRIVTATESEIAALHDWYDGDTRVVSKTEVDDIIQRCGEQLKLAVAGLSLTYACGDCGAEVDLRHAEAI